MIEDDLNIEFLAGPCPMQGWGTIGESEFYFRARWDYWSFAISEDSNLDSVAINSSEQGFYIEESYGDSPYDAGYMTEDEAESIIKRCIREYIAKNS